MIVRVLVGTKQIETFVTAQIPQLNISIECNMPINIGTEMNKLGLPFVDDLDCEALMPYKETFLHGAKIMTGHTLLLRHAGFSYISEKANSEFSDTKIKNHVFLPLSP